MVQNIPPQNGKPVVYSVKNKQTALSRTPLPKEAPREPSRPWYVRKRMWAVLVLLVMLLLGSWFVPAGKIPLLRQIVAAMGYSADEAEKTSLLKALLNWREHNRIARGEKEDSDELAVFTNSNVLANAIGVNGMDEPGKVKNSLYNVASVNAALAKQGKQAEKVTGSAYTGPRGEEDPNAPAVSVTDTRASAATQANAQTADVYFGADVSAVGRNKKDGYNSVNLLSKIRNPHITGGAGAGDWLDRLIDKASMESSGMENLFDNNEGKNMKAMNSEMTNLGKTRAQRDMYFAWLMSRAANRTPQVILKKTLASAGWEGGELHNMVFTAGGFSGVNIKEADIEVDINKVEKYLGADERCEAAIKATDATINNAMEQAIASINGLWNKFPTTCDEANDNSFLEELAKIRAQCEQARAAYNVLSNGCSAMRVNVGSCTTNKLEDRFAAYQLYCQTAADECTAHSQNDPEFDEQACMNEREKADDYKEGDCEDGCSTGDIKELVKDSFNVVIDGETNENASGCFSQITWGDGSNSEGFDINLDFF